MATDSAARGGWSAARTISHVAVPTSPYPVQPGEAKLTPEYFYREFVPPPEVLQPPAPPRPLAPPPPEPPPVAPGA